MMNEDIESIVEIIRHAFQTRDFSPMVEAFDENGVYETPYATENNWVQGIESIRQRFAVVTNSPWYKVVKVEKVTVNSTPAADGKTVFVEFRIKGKRINDDSLFDFPSSVAIIQISNAKIINYRDYPNVTGIRQAAGV